MQLFSNILVFNVWLPKGKKEKMERKIKGTGPLNLLKVTSARGGWACSNGGKCNSNDCLFAPLRSDQQPGIWAQISSYLESRVQFLPTLAPASVCQGHGEHVQGHLEPECGRWDYVRSWDWPKLTATDHASLLLKVINRFKGSQIVQSDRSPRKTAV